MKLRCVAKYVNDAINLRFVKGDEFEPPDELAAFLLSDAPGCFEEVPDKPIKEEKPQAKQVSRPARNKAVAEPEEDK